MSSVVGCSCLASARSSSFTAGAPYRKAEGSPRGLTGVPPSGLASASRALLARYGLAIGGGLLLLLLPAVYAALAAGSPGIALLVTSAMGLVAVTLLTFFAWPMERKITWQRQAEVAAYRLGAALGTYVGLGVTVLFLVNTFTAQQVPLAWPGEFLRRVPFWPFYGLVILACRTFLPAPPDACLA